MTIAVTGSTGQLGRLVVNKLKEKVSAADIVALARWAEKAADFGVIVREADYSKLETLDRALDGIDTMLLISSNEVGKRAVQHNNVIEVAKKVGIKWIVYTNLLHADTSPLSLAGEHLATEAELMESGIPFTILRHGWYTENYTNSIPGALASGSFIGSAGDGKISSATRADYAESAVAVLTGGDMKARIMNSRARIFYTLRPGSRNFPPDRQVDTLLKYVRSGICCRA